MTNCYVGTVKDQALATVVDFDCSIEAGATGSTAGHQTLKINWNPKPQGMNLRYAGGDHHWNAIGSESRGATARRIRYYVSNILDDSTLSIDVQPHIADDVRESKKVKPLHS